MNDELTIVYPNLRSSSGTKSYIENTISGLDQMGVKFNKITIKKREITISGKPYFGILLQYISSLFKKGNTKVVHSLSPDVVIKGTNIVTIHDIIPFIKPEIYMRSTYNRIAYGLSFERSLKVKSLLVSTEIGKKELLEKTDVSPERVSVIHHSIDHRRFFPVESNPYPEDGKINIAMVSDFNPRKRIDKIIQAIGGDPEINFYHIGPLQGWEYRYKELRKMSELYNNIHFMGALANNKMREYLSFADLFIYLSDGEGFGLPPLEAMACGSNVLVNDLPVFRETLNGFASFANLEDFSKEDIIRSLKSKKSKNDLINYTQRFSIKQHATSLLEAYMSILEK